MFYVFITFESAWFNRYVIKKLESFSDRYIAKRTESIEAAKVVRSQL